MAAVKRLMVGSVYSVAENVDRISVFIEALNDPHRSIDRRAEETGDRRIALIFNGSRKRRKLCLVVPDEAWIQILETHKLLETAGSQAHGAVTQPVHEIHVADLEQTQRTGVSGKSAAVVHHARLLLFDVDDDVSVPV